jgi:hypothetical protein
MSLFLEQAARPLHFTKSTLPKYSKVCSRDYNIWGTHHNAEQRQNDLINSDSKLVLLCAFI